MAAPMAVDLIQNEFYELKDPIEEESYHHPYLPLTHFKIVMVAERTPNRGVVFKWPSFRSLAFFYQDRLDVMPTLDKERTLSELQASSLVLRHLDPVRLCFHEGRFIDAWLHDPDDALEYQLGQIVAEITPAHRTHTRNTRIRPNHFYAFRSFHLPGYIAAVTGYSRVAWVSGLVGGQNPTVQVRVPSLASLAVFHQTESLTLPDFDYAFSISRDVARSFLTRIMPIQLCFQLRKRRDFWINVNHHGLLPLPLYGA